MKCVVIHANVLWAIVNFRLEFIHFLQKSGYKVVCVSDTDNFSDLSLEKLNQYGIEFYKVPLGRKSLNPLAEMRYMYALFSVYKRIKPDIILSYSIKPNIFGNVVARMMGIPVISTINGLGSGFLGQSWLRVLVQSLYKIGLTSAKIVFFQNNEDKSLFLEKGMVTPTQARYMPGSGVKVENFSDCAKTDSTNVSFCLIARLIKDKGILEYIEAIRLLRKNHSFETDGVFYLAGALDEGNPSGISKESVDAWEKEGLVQYLGVTDVIQDFLKCLDVVVLPSYREGLSRVLLEAASAKKAIITTDTAGCRDMVDDGKNGFLVKVASAESLCEGFVKILSLPSATIQNMGENGYTKVKTAFSQEKINALYLEAIREVVKNA